MERKKRETGSSEDITGREKDLRTRDDLDFLTDPDQIRSIQAEMEEISLGSRIKMVREKKGISIDELSSLTKIDGETLLKIEKNELVPPLGELIKLGKALSTKMGHLISPGKEKFSIVRSNQRRPITRFGKEKAEKYGYFYESLAPDKKDRSMEPFMITLMPSDVEDFSQHDGEEFIYVLEGEMEVRVGNYRDILYPGDAIYYESQMPHLVKAHGSKSAKILAVLYA
jgi:quercetin dioxygenase-like cupin family protein/ribosome-binding protein aMBF1 (putative translation factor)